MHSLVDQEELKAKTQCNICNVCILSFTVLPAEWKELLPHDNFFFRPYVKQEETETEDNCQVDDDDDVPVGGSFPDGGLLVAYQSQWQKRLLARYGSVCLLDATYKTTRYSLPLFSSLCARMLTRSGCSVRNTVRKCCQHIRGAATDPQLER